MCISDFPWLGQLSSNCRYLDRCGNFVHHIDAAHKNSSFDCTLVERVHCTNDSEMILGRQMWNVRIVESRPVVLFTVLFLQFYFLPAGDVSSTSSDITVAGRNCFQVQNQYRWQCLTVTVTVVLALTLSGYLVTRLIRKCASLCRVAHNVAVGL